MLKFTLSIISGTLLAKSYSEEKWMLAIIALAILIWLLDHSHKIQRSIITFIFFSTFFLLHLSWVRVIGNDAWLALVIICSVPWLLIALIPVNRKSIFSTLTFSAMAVLVEIIRSHFPWGGFPWGLIAYSQVDGPLVEYARIGGQYLVSFIVVFTAGLIVRFLSFGFFGSRIITSAIVLLLIAFGAANLTVATKQNLAPQESFKVVAIQGNVPRAGLAIAQQRKAVLNNHLNRTREFIESNNWSSDYDLILWPESSTDIDPLANDDVALEISKLVQDSDTPILVGATIWGSAPEGPRNVGILWRGNDIRELYVKNHLVPYGEWIPFRSILKSFVDRISLVPNDFIAGNELGLFEINRIIFGDVICFEVAYGDYIRNLVINNARFITVQTNNATYGYTSQPEQQFQITRFRAIEHRRSFIVASTSGISGVINPDGEVVSKTEQFVPAAISAELPIIDSITFSDKYPRWFAFVCVIYLVLSIGVTSLANRMK